MESKGVKRSLNLMLALSCWPREVVVIGSDTIIYIGEIRESKIRIGIDAPKRDKILRMDLIRVILENNGYRFAGVDGPSLMYNKNGKVLNVVEAVKELIETGKLVADIDSFNGEVNN